MMHDEVRPIDANTLRELVEDMYISRLALDDDVCDLKIILDSINNAPTIKAKQDAHGWCNICNQLPPDDVWVFVICQNLMKRTQKFGHPYLDIRKRVHDEWNGSYLRSNNRIVRVLYWRFLPEWPEGVRNDIQI